MDRRHKGPHLTTFLSQYEQAQKSMWRGMHKAVLGFSAPVPVEKQAWPRRAELSQTIRTVQEVQLTWEVRVRQPKHKIPTPPFFPRVICNTD